MADRQKGVQIHRPIIYGSHARLLSEAERRLAPPDHTHRWTIFLASATSPPPKPGDAENMDYMPGNADDLSYMIKRVTFKLHETYPTPNRAVDKPPYQVSETGWGEFTVNIRVQFVQEAGEKPMNLALPIKLHHWGAPIEGVPAPSAPVTAVSTPAPAPPAEPIASGSGEVKTEQPEKKDGDGDVNMESKEGPKDTAEDSKENADADGETDVGESITIDTPAPPPSAPAPTGPTSIAARYPVHAWQYDEIIFSDPPLAFYNILNENPPTPLPARNRRARDQRDANTKQKKKGRVSAIAASASNSRAGTPQPVEGSVPPPAAVPAPGSQVGVGIPGEPGSADVPLEFTAEMEKGEWNRLHDARKKIIEEMDRWRIKLIEEEKELQKLKDEMSAPAATPA